MKRSLDTGSSGAAASAHAGHSDTTNPYLAHHNSAPKMAKSDGTNPHTGAPYSDRYRRILAGRLTLPVYVVASTRCTLTTTLLLLQLPAPPSLLLLLLLLLLPLLVLLPTTHSPPRRLP